MDCNPNVDESAHPNACEAARAAEAARVMGGNEMFWRMADRLYKNQEALGKIDYGDLATEIGLDAEEFRKTMESKPVYQRVDEDIALGGKAKAHHQTPTLFRDNRSWRMWTTGPAWNDWKDKVKAEAKTKLSSEQPQTRPAVRVQPNP
jgi:protein-disulfide isomerase-like protein with CxxC motif